MKGFVRSMILKATNVERASLGFAGLFGLRKSFQ